MKIDAEELTDEELDTLLERFDQTEPPLARRVVAQFVIDSAIAEAQVRQLEDKISRALALLKPQTNTVNPSLMAVRQAVSILK